MRFKLVIEMDMGSLIKNETGNTIRRGEVIYELLNATGSNNTFVMLNGDNRFTTSNLVTIILLWDL